MWKPSYTILFALVLLSAIGLRVWQSRWPTAEITLKDIPLRVLVADTPVHRYRGLGQRDDLGRFDGMLFLFPEAGRHGIVMRDMRFSIDVVWIADGVVVDIAERLPLQRGVSEGELRGYFPRTEADMVLELPAGWAAVHELKIGDRLTTS